MALDPIRICNDLQSALTTLHGSGPEGFEGLVRDAYREATGTSLRLQKSGTQKGADAVPGDAEARIAAGIEAKRYRETTPLRLDELKNKVIDAATRRDNPLELWILAASKEISGDDAEELRRIGADHGLGVLILDWRSEGDPTAPLPLLMTLAPNAVRRHLGDAIADAVDKLSGHPEYAVQKEAFLQQLQRPDMGLSHAARSVKERIAQTLQSRANAKAQLQNPVDIEAPGRRWIARDGHCRAIREWKDNAAKTPVVAAVGEEGAGKTWLMFDWWRREIAGDTPPLILWQSARDVASGSIADVIGAALAKWVQVPKRDSAFWSRRVELWRRVHGNDPKVPFIWLMLDGVNEGMAQDNVMRVLNEAVASEWKGRIGLLLSDRPPHWERTFLCGRSLEIPQKVIRVGQFSDAELDSLLTMHGKSRDDFSAKVLKIIRWPRWFAVAADMFDKEHDWSAHSPEQLMLRYWQHHLHDRGQIAAIDDVMFRDFVARLGAEIKESLAGDARLSTARLKEILSGDSGAAEKDVMSAVDDITSGIWMHPAGAYQYEIDQAVLPFAIGLALLDEMRLTLNDEEADSACDRFLGPIEGQTIGVDILAAAVSLGFVDDELPEHPKRVLMTRWISAHNFGQQHFALLLRIAGASPDTFFSVAESLWLQRSTGHSVDEILIKGIATIADSASRMPDVIGFLAKWARTYWPDPNEGAYLNYNPSDEERAAARTATDARLGQLRTELGEEAFAHMNLRLCENGGGASWLSHRIFSVATYLPRAAQRPIWQGWALSRAVMGRPRHFDELAWSLRLNPVDGPAAGEALIDEVDNLLALGSDMVRAQVLSLLDAHAGPEAAVKLRSMEVEFQTRIHRRNEEDVAVADEIVDITPGKERSDREIAALLSGFAPHPEVDISAAQKEILERYAADFPVKERSDGRDRTAADIELERAEPALARWAPDALAGLYRRALDSIRTRSHEELLGYALSLDDLLVLLRAETQAAIEATLVAASNERSGQDLGQIGRSLWSAAIFGKAPADQYRIWQEINAPESVPERLSYLVRPLPIDLLHSLENELHPDRDRGRLVGWLAYLRASDTRKWPENWEALWRLFAHDDNSVRSMALQNALGSENHEFGQRLYETDWSAAPERGFIENCAGTWLLSQVATDDNFEAIAARVDPEWADMLWEQFDYDAPHRGPFLEFLEASVERECNPPPRRTYPEYRCSPDKATLKLLEQDAPAVTALADRLFGLKRMPTLVGFDWPRIHLLQAFFEVNPSQAVLYWKRMEEIKEPIVGRSELFDSLPFAAPDGAEVNALRERLVNSATNDWMLMTLATTVIRKERTEWAVDWIKQSIVEAKHAGDIARAVTFAGLLDDSQAARDLWATVLGEAPLDGWNGLVYGHAKGRIEQAWDAVHWLDQALTADSDERFFACWRLFAHSADFRSLPLAARRLRQRPAGMSRRRSEFMDFSWQRVADRTKKEKTNLERTLFATRTGFRWALPWAG